MATAPTTSSTSNKSRLTLPNALKWRRREKPRDVRQKFLQQLLQSEHDERQRVEEELRQVRPPRAYIPFAGV